MVFAGDEYLPFVQGVPRHLNHHAFHHGHHFQGRYQLLYSGYVLFVVDPTVKGNMAQLADWVTQGDVHPVVEEKVYTLTTTSVRALFQAPMSHRSKGKLVLDVG